MTAPPTDETWLDKLKPLLTTRPGAPLHVRVSDEIWEALVSVVAAAGTFKLHSESLLAAPSGAVTIAEMSIWTRARDELAAALANLRRVVEGEK